MSTTDLDIFEAIIQFAACKNWNHTLLGALEDAEKQFPLIESHSNKIGLILFLTHAVRIVDEFEQAGYTDGSEAESDEEPAKDYIEDIRQILRDLAGKPELHGFTQKPIMERFSRYTVIHEVLRHLSRALCGGNIPKTAKDFTRNMKTFDFSDLKQEILEIFESRRIDYYDEDDEEDETFELDLKQFCHDLAVESKGKKKTMLHPLTLIERFDKYSVAQYANELREELLRLRSKVFVDNPLANLLQAMSNNPGRAEEIVAEVNDWDSSRRSIVYSSGEKAKKAATPSSLRKGSQEPIETSSSSALPAALAAPPVAPAATAQTRAKESSPTPIKSISTVMHQLHSKNQHLVDEGKRKDPLRFIDESSAPSGSLMLVPKAAAIAAVSHESESSHPRDGSRKRLIDSRPSSSKVPVSPIGVLEEEEEAPSKRSKVEEDEGVDAIDEDIGHDELNISQSNNLQRLREITEEVTKRVASHQFPDQLGSPARKAEKKSQGDGKKRSRWSADEESRFLSAIRKHGVGNWATMLEDPEFSVALRQRNNVQLKDKYRNLLKAGVVGEDFAAGSRSATKKQKKSDNLQPDIDSDSDSEN